MHFVRNGRKQEWESLKIALDKKKESKGKHPKQPDEKEREVAYSQMAQNMERTRTVVRNSIEHLPFLLNPTSIRYSNCKNHHTSTGDQQT